MRFIALVLLLAGCATTPAPRMTDEVRQQQEAELAVARSAYLKNPHDPEAIIWLGRRLGYLGKYSEAIDVFSEGILKHPEDARMYRHRGHRWITLREPERAIEDLKRASDLIRGMPDAVEPDGLPNARNIPTSTLQSNIWYHLGLAHYLKGEFGRALDAYRECLAVSKNPDGVVSTTHWLYMTLRRLGRAEEAAQTLVPISSDMDVIENSAYHELLLMARGEIDPRELASRDPSTVDGVTTLYGVGNWYLYNGQPGRAREIFESIVAGPQWSAFGYIAAEAELRRMRAERKRDGIEVEVEL